MNVSTYVLPVLLIALIIVCIVKKVKVYDCFLLGAKDGLNLVIDVFPYIASIFVCIELFKASGLSSTIFRLACKAAFVYRHTERSDGNHTSRSPFGQRHDCPFGRHISKIRRGFVYSEMRRRDCRGKRNDILYLRGVLFRL